MTISRPESSVSGFGASERGALIPQLVAAQARNNPDSAALIADGRTVSYRELDSRANRLANYLRAAGVGADVLVGLCLPRSLEMVVGALGILKAGGAYVPLDPSYPPERLAFMLDDAQAPLLVTSPPVAERLPHGRWQLVYVGDPRVADQPRVAPSVDSGAGDLAYVIYTSGSTGRPKGVEITHSSLTNLVDWHVQAFSVTAADQASQVAGLGFDATVWELWPYLAVGACVHLAGEETRNSAELLRDWLLAQKITIGFVPTPLLEHLLTLPWPRTSALRVLLTGGDTLHRYPPADLPFVLVNNYGPTECTVVGTSGLIPPEKAPTIPPPIGRAIANTRIYLLDEQLSIVPVGEAGEIYIGGAGLARGYRNHPALTAERFVPDPFAGQPGSRLYKTGDLGRFLPDGQVAFLGRADDQIKIRGYRIEPGEISSRLNQHADVRASLIVAREDTPGNKRLVAYVLLKPDADPTYTELRDFLGGFLPEYMLPAAFVRLDAFPLTRHGKIDRTALPAPEPANTLQDEVSDGPRTEIEQRVAEILGELLELEEIGLDDNFFMLGGHSLLGAQLISRLRGAFDVDIGLRTLFEAPTVAALSVEIECLTGRHGRDPSRPDGSPGQPRD
jgi:amino acid adenylation domain-containing protein